MARRKYKKKFLFRSGRLLWYEYRGKEYCVNEALFTSTLNQHIMEQNSIDDLIEKEKMIAERDAKKEHRHEDTADYGFEVFWKSVQ